MIGGKTVRPSDLDLRELLDFDPKGGAIRFAGERALLLDAVALGLLRQRLIQTLGASGARAVLTQFGYAHGVRSADTLRSAFPWDSERDWKTAGGRVHTLQGLVEVEPLERLPGDGPPPFAESIWKDSYEAEQHLLYQGLSEEPVCWSLCGFASGYLTTVNGKEIYCIEEKCVGKGDAYCQMVGRPKEEWGEAIVPHLPFFKGECLNAVLRGVTEQLKRAESRLRSRKKELARAAGTQDDPSGIVARSEAMRQVLDLARRSARVDTTVLLSGPSGAGKERVARLIHEESARAGGPFVAVNCAAVAESLLESELFGHARGAFTGATHDRPGLFEAAGGGTLFLDEVGEVPASMQAKLLRALQEREVRRVGENGSRRIDVRLLAATNKDLSAEVGAGRFRQDLFYRLRVIELRVPPLRDRKEDILPLARTFLAEAAGRMGRSVAGFTPEVADQLLRHRWPGNVRELENAIERAVALCAGDRVQLDDLPEEVRSAPPAATLWMEPRHLEEVERSHIIAVLEQNGGNRHRAASQLGIGTATLYRKLKRYRGLSGS
ncbi:MAG: sigma-54-dependent Fis family transcriptional regulator [Myxococcales bacterium]|nr:sigma-54-dependent Fis family transcriptional regulator [Myxococcales bacterium]